MKSDENGGAEPTVQIPPGMSEYTFKRVTSENPLQAWDLEKVWLKSVIFWYPC